MRKYSDMKTERAIELARVVNVLASAAQFASTADALLVKLAARGARFATQWTKDERVYSREEISKCARAIETTGRALPKSQVNLAVIAYARGLDQFAACDYAGAQKSIEISESLLAQ